MTRLRLLGLDEALNNDVPWQEHFDNRDFWQIMPDHRWPEPDLRDLLSRLKLVVPKRTYGDGVETYEDFIKYFHAEAPDEYEAAFLLHQVQGLLERLVHTGDQSYPSPFEYAVVRATEALQAHGIEYRGLRKTYLVWLRKQERYFQETEDVRLELYAARKKDLGDKFDPRMFAWDNNFVDDTSAGEPIPTPPGEVPGYDHWMSAYGFRAGLLSLRVLFEAGRIEPHTSLWHAVHILQNYETFVECYCDLEGRPITERFPQQSFGMQVLSAAQIGIYIGKSLDALEKKHLEHEALASLKTKQMRAKAGGQKSASNRVERVEALMCAIEALGDLYPRVSEAALIMDASKNAVLQDPDLLRQGKGLVDTYLSEIIRSEEPYKSRYYAIFDKTA